MINLDNTYVNLIKKHQLYWWITVIICFILWIALSLVILSFTPHLGLRNSMFLNTFTSIVLLILIYLVLYNPILRLYRAVKFIKKNRKQTIQNLSIVHISEKLITLEKLAFYELEVRMDGEISKVYVLSSIGILQLQKETLYKVKLSGRYLMGVCYE